MLQGVTMFRSLKAAALLVRKQMGSRKKQIPTSRDATEHLSCDQLCVKFSSNNYFLSYDSKLLLIIH